MVVLHSEAPKVNEVLGLRLIPVPESLQHTKTTPGLQSAASRSPGNRYLYVNYLVGVCQVILNIPHGPLWCARTGGYGHFDCASANSRKRRTHDIIIQRWPARTTKNSVFYLQRVDGAKTFSHPFRGPFCRSLALQGL
eukprot:scaffold139321_cov37-Prasinocladus_malaysianus.AAC.1